MIPKDITNMVKSGYFSVFVLTLSIFSMSVCKIQAREQDVVFETSAITLGSQTDFDKIGRVLLANPGVWGAKGTDGNISYRMLKPNVAADVLFAAFGTNENGLCKDNLILEVFFRDDISKWTGKESPAAKKIHGNIAIQSRIDFFKDNQFVEVGHLNVTGDGQWKLAHIFLEKTPRQMVRAIDGSFHFRIMTSAFKGSGLPISYIKLRAVTHEELVELREADRASRGWGLIRIEYEPEPGSQKDSCQPKGDFVVYPANYLKMVFPNSPVDCDRIGDELKCFEIPGQAEPVSFVLHSYTDLYNVWVQASDLSGEKGHIAANNIDIRRVIYNDQRWGFQTDNHYGLCPDYLGFKNPVGDIKADTNCQFWLTISVPENTPPGLYKGKVVLYIKDKDSYTIPLLVEVLPVKLLENQVKHMIYFSPYFRGVHRDPIKVFEDMKKHNVVPIFYLTMEFENQLQSFRKIFPETKEIFLMLLNHDYIWNLVKGPKPQFITPFPAFNVAYDRNLKKHADLAARYGLELYFSFHDEPFRNPKNRRISYLCSSIAQSNGLKTWSTHRLRDDVQLPLSEYEIRSNVNYLRPLRDVLDVFAEPLIEINETTVKTFQKTRTNLSYYTTYLATMVVPIYNRLFHGIYPFVTKSRFVLVYAYRHSHVDPYDDMDLNADYFYRVGRTDFLLTYPTWRGDILPTLCYETLREAVEDSHLISTLQILVRQALQRNKPEAVRLAEEADEYLNDIFNRVSKDFENAYWKKHRNSPVDPMEKAILKDMDEGQGEGYGVFDEIRRNICDKIIKLQSFN
jgi:hypothetical protein